ncbi:MAG: hypothetical protein H0V73_12600, partial [Chloroflexi bacterium]|nr:hypothetical protein [Chloroflexota bacterium]
MLRWSARLALLLSVVLGSSVLAPATGAATPPSGVVSTANPSVSWTGPAKTASTAGPSDLECAAPASPPLPGGYCDDFGLTVDIPTTYWATHSGGVQIDLTGLPPANDYDFYVYDRNGSEVASAGLPGGVESALIPCA